MLQRCCVRVCGGVALVLAVSAVLAAADLSDALQAIKSVDSEGRGNADAAGAFKLLARERAAALPSILAALDDANPLAANYLRNAIEAIAQRELQQGGKLPVEALEAFVQETAHAPRARRLAFELLARVDQSAPDRLIPGMLNDPSVELRRDAVQRLIVQGNEQFEKENKSDAKATYERAIASARDDDQVQAIKKRLAELGEKVDLPRHFGFLLNWRLIAPFDNVEKKGFNVVYPPEKELDFNAEYEGKEGMKVRWTSHTTDNEYGIVDLAKALAPFKGAISYAATEFVSDKERTVDFRLGTPNSWKVWLNGELLFAREEYHRGMSLDQYRMRGKLKAGKNVILIKVLQNEQTEEWAQRWQFQLRVCDATGTAVLSADRTAAQSPAG
ncbi:MAG TPA: hypothetical protein VL475_10800, partial [Planctomycetaceae bacterium]|nr:hypothetical protein [Planctomycetaceae bacterium]